MDYAVAKEALKDLSGGTFLGIDTVTTVAMKGGKKNPYLGRVSKVMLGASVMVFSDTHSVAYENMVNRRLKSEAAAAGREFVPFEVGERKWGTKIEGTPFVVHADTYYLQMLFTQSPSSIYYFLDDKPLDLDMKVEADYAWAFALVREALAKEPAAGTGQGGLIEKVIIRTIKLENILAMRHNGIEYK